MNPRYLVPVSRVTLVILLLGCVVAQVLIPLAAVALGARYPEAERLVVPYSAAAVLAIACVEATLWLAWRLVSLVEDGAIISSRAVRLVSAIGGCAAAVAALSAGVLVHLAVDARFGGPGVGLLLLGCIGAGVVGALLALRVRRLMRESLLGFKPESHSTLQDCLSALTMWPASHEKSPSERAEP